VKASCSAVWYPRTYSGDSVGAGVGSPVYSGASGASSKVSMLFVGSAGGGPSPGLGACLGLAPLSLLGPANSSAFADGLCSSAAAY
jgi:hypothetical protein